MILPIILISILLLKTKKNNQNILNNISNNMHINVFQVVDSTSYFCPISVGFVKPLPRILGLCLVRLTWGFVQYVGALSSICPLLLHRLNFHPFYTHPIPLYIFYHTLRYNILSRVVHIYIYIYTYMYIQIYCPNQLQPIGFSRCC